MLADQQVGAIGHLLLVHYVDGALGGVSLAEGDVALVEEGLLTALASSLNMSRLNFPELSEHLLESLVVGARGQALHEQVEEAAFASLALLAALVVQNLDLLPVDLEFT